MTKYDKGCDLRKGGKRDIMASQTVTNMKKEPYWSTTRQY